MEDAIEQQILHNRNKSIFYEINGRLALSYSKVTINLLTQKAAEISKFIQTSKLDGTYKQLLRYIADKSIILFMEVNQYLDFNREDYRKLQNIYGDLFERVCDIGNQERVSEKK